FGASAIVTGYFQNGLMVGMPPLADPSFEIFLMKLDLTDGTPQLAKMYGETTSNQLAYAFAPYGANKLVLAGSFDGPLNFGNGALTAMLGSTPLFFAELDTNGLETRASA